MRALMFFASIFKGGVKWIGNTQKIFHITSIRWTYRHGNWLKALQYEKRIIEIFVPFSYMEKERPKETISPKIVFHMAWSKDISRPTSWSETDRGIDGCSTLDCSVAPQYRLSAKLTRKSLSMLDNKLSSKTVKSPTNCCKGSSLKPEI